MQKIKVLVADDHPVFLEGLCSILTLRDSEIELVSSVSDGREAVEEVKKLTPDVVLLDIKMPVINGVEAARIIKESTPETKIIMLTNFEDRDLIIAALKVGANGYILKDAPIPQLIQSIRTVYQGNVLISPKVAEKLISTDEKQDIGNQSIPQDGKLDDLTSREKQILILMTRGRENWEIAQELFISEKTVRNYASQIYAILGVNNRTQAVLWALENGIM